MCTISIPELFPICSSVTILMSRPSSHCLPHLLTGCFYIRRFGKMVACFRYASIDVHSVYLPPAKLEFNYENQEWIQKETNEVQWLWFWVSEVIWNLTGPQWSNYLVKNRWLTGQNYYFLKYAMLSIGFQRKDMGWGWLLSQDTKLLN